MFFSNYAFSKLYEWGLRFAKHFGKSKNVTSMSSITLCVISPKYQVYSPPLRLSPSSLAGAQWPRLWVGAIQLPAIGQPLPPLWGWGPAARHQRDLQGPKVSGASWHFHLENVSLVPRVYVSSRLSVLVFSLQLPHHIHGLRLEQISHYVLATQQLGFTLAWDGGSGSVYIKLSPEFVGRTCGLCGNFNADVRDDLKTSFGKK